MEYIPINIWDDFSEEKGSTFISIEDDGELSFDLKDSALTKLKDYLINKLNTKVELSFVIGSDNFIELVVENLTYDELDRWMEHFDNTEITLNEEYILDIYSES